jgi:hypothetical protein
MTKCYLLPVLVLATACGRTDSAPIDVDDHQTCLGYGFIPGTDGFAACKMRLKKITLRSNSYRTMGKRIPARAGLQRTHLIGRHSPADDVARSTCHRPLPKAHMRKIGLMAVPFDESRAAWLMSARG